MNAPMYKMRPRRPSAIPNVIFGLLIINGIVFALQQMNGRFLVVKGPRGSQIRVVAWNIETRKKVLDVKAAGRAWQLDLDVSPDSRFVAFFGSKGIEIHDLPTLSTAIRKLEQLPNVVSVRRKA